MGDDHCGWRIVLAHVLLAACLAPLAGALVHALVVKHHSLSKADLVAMILAGVFEACWLMSIVCGVAP